MNIEQAAKQLEALGSPTRLEVYRTLVRAGHAGLPVGLLQEKLGIPASTLSHHLHRLILTGLVTQEWQATTLISRPLPGHEHDPGLSRGRVLRRCRMRDSGRSGGLTLLFLHLISMMAEKSKEMI